MGRLMYHCKTHGDSAAVGCPECVAEMRADLRFIEKLVAELNDHNVRGNTSGVVALACQQILKRIRRQP
ncbi:MAG: hypothetical protein ABH877_04320 [bacterium]